MGWPTNPRPCKAALHLRDRIQDLRPDLNPAGFGILGDAAHATRSSDHNPWVHDDHGIGVARALDIPLKVGRGNRKAADKLRRMAKGNRLLGRKPHQAFGSHGYIISDRRITSAKSGWRWRPYTGPDPHTGHIHVSFGLAQARYDSHASWSRIKLRHVK